MYRYRHESKLRYLVRYLWVNYHPYLATLAFCFIIAGLLVVRI